MHGSLVTSSLICLLYTSDAADDSLRVDLGGRRIIKKNRTNGKKFTVGVSINNLSLNDNDIGDFKTFLKLSPPLRTEKDRISLIKGIKEGYIDVIVSDHKPEDEESKRLPFAQAATGAIGVETLLPLALELYHNNSSVSYTHLTLPTTPYV